MHKILKFTRNKKNQWKSCFCGRKKCKFYL